MELGIHWNGNGSAIEEIQKVLCAYIYSHEVHSTVAVCKHFVEFTGRAPDSFCESVGMWPSATLSRYYAMWSPWNNEFRHRLYTAITLALPRCILVLLYKWLFCLCSEIKKEKDILMIQNESLLKLNSCDSCRVQSFYHRFFFSFVWLFWFFFAQIDKEIKSNSSSEFPIVLCRLCSQNSCTFRRLSQLVFFTSKFHRLIQTKNVQTLFSQSGESRNYKWSMELF